MVLLALSDTAATIGLVVVFMVVFPAIATGLIAFALAQAVGERVQNQHYQRRGHNTEV